MQQPHSTGPAGHRNNVYRLGNAPAVLRSRKPRNHCRTWLEQFCALKPESRLRVIKTLLAESRDHSDDSEALTASPHHWPASFYLRNGIPRVLWERAAMSLIPPRPIPEYQSLRQESDWQKLLECSRAMLEQLQNNYSPPESPEQFQAVAHLVITLAPSYCWRLH